MKLTNKQAIEASMAVTKLLNMVLPIKTSLDIALLSSELDKQISIFSKVRDHLIANYKIKVSAGEKAGEAIFTAPGSDSEEKTQAINEFTSKINELIGTETNDIVVKICLPNSINISPDILKPLLPFITLGE